MKGNVGNVGSRRVAWALVKQRKYAHVNFSLKLSLFDVLVAIVIVIAIAIAVVVAKVSWCLGNSSLPPFRPRRTYLKIQIR